MRRSEQGQWHPPVGSWASSRNARNTMVATRGRDTIPERRLRSAAHRLGLRYRVSARPLPSMRRTADLLFARERLAVFVDGCFWHSCVAHSSTPHTNVAFWSEKLARTAERDRETDAALVAAGWTVLRIWEHEDPIAASHQVLKILMRLRGANSRDPGRETGC
jgi:DNA mismatch endonuclease (patch repair protein)